MAVKVGMVSLGCPKASRVVKNVHFEPHSSNLKKQKAQTLSVLFALIGAQSGTRTHMVSRTILSRVRLPVPPSRHFLLYCVSRFNHINIIFIFCLVPKCIFYWLFGKINVWYIILNFKKRGNQIYVMFRM